MFRQESSPFKETIRYIFGLCFISISYVYYDRFTISSWITMFISMALFKQRAFGSFKSRIVRCISTVCCTLVLTMPPILLNKTDRDTIATQMAKLSSPPQACWNYQYCLLGTIPDISQPARPWLGNTWDRAPWSRTKSLQGASQY